MEQADSSSDCSDEEKQDKLVMEDMEQKKESEFETRLRESSLYNRTSRQQQLQSQKDEKSQSSKIIVPIISSVNINDWDPQQIKSITQSNAVDFRERDVSLVNSSSIFFNNSNNHSVAINILSRPVKTKEEQSFLMRGVQGLKLFQENQNIFQESQMNHQLFKQIKLEYFQKDDVIFNIGSVFCLLKEAAMSTLNSQASFSDIPKLTDKKFSKMNSQEINVVKKRASREINLQSTQSKKNSITRQKSSEFSNEEREDIQELKKIYPNLECAKIYQPGEAFGEISLMTNASRTATMICREDTYVMTLNKQGFDKIVGAYHDFIMRERLAFLQNFSFFRDIHPSKLLSILHFMSIEKFEKKKVIYKEGDDVNSIYFIKSGEIQMFKDIYLDTQGSLGEEDKDNNNNNKSFSKKNVNYNIVDIKKNQKKNKKKIALSILSNNNLFGEEEIQKNLSKRQNEAVVYSTEATLFVIKKEKLIDNLRLNNMLEVFMKGLQPKQNFSIHRQSIMLQTLDLEIKSKAHYQQSADSEKILSKIKLDSHFQMRESLNDSSDVDDSSEDFDKSLEKDGNSQYSPRNSQIYKLKNQIKSSLNKTPIQQRGSIMQRKSILDKSNRSLNNLRLQHIRGGFDSPGKKRNSIYVSEGFQLQSENVESNSPSHFHRSDSKTPIKQIPQQTQSEPQKLNNSEIIKESPKEEEKFAQHIKIQNVLSNLKYEDTKLKQTRTLDLNSPRMTPLNREFSPQIKPSSSFKNSHIQNAFSFTPQNIRSMQINDFSESIQENKSPLIVQHPKPSIDQIQQTKKRKSQELLLKYLEKQGLLNSYVEDWQNQSNFNQSLLKFLEERNPNQSKVHNIFNIISTEMQSLAKTKQNNLNTQSFNIFSISDEQIKQRINIINSSIQKHPTEMQVEHQNAFTDFNQKYKQMKPILQNKKFKFDTNNSEISQNINSQFSQLDKNYLSQSTRAQNSHHQHFHPNQNIFKQKASSPSNSQILKPFLKNLDKYDVKKEEKQQQSPKQNEQLNRANTLTERSLASSNNQSFTLANNNVNLSTEDKIVENVENTDKSQLLFQTLPQNAGNKQNEDLFLQNSSVISEISLQPQQSNQFGQIKINLNKLSEINSQNDHETIAMGQNTDKPSQFSRRMSNIEDKQGKIKQLKESLSLGKLLRTDQETQFFQSLTARNGSSSIKQSVPDLGSPYSARIPYIQSQIPYQKQYCLVNKLGFKKNQSSNVTKQNLSNERTISQKESLIISTKKRNNSSHKKKEPQQQAVKCDYAANYIQSSIASSKKGQNAALPYIYNSDSFSNHPITAFTYSNMANYPQTSQKYIQSQTNIPQNAQSLYAFGGTQNQAKNVHPKQLLFHQGMNMHYTIKKHKNEYFSHFLKSPDTSKNNLQMGSQESAELVPIFDQTQGLNIFALKSNPVKHISHQKQNNNFLK